MNPKVTGLKVLKQYVYADVELGYHNDSGRVTTTVRMRATDPEVEEAMRPLLELAAQQATTVVREADFDEQVEVRSREAVRESIKAETERINRNNRHALDNVLNTFTRLSAEGSDYSVRSAAERAVTALRGLTGRG